MDALAKDVIGEWERLDGERGTFKTHWQDVANFSLPDRNDYIVEKTAGQKRMTYIYDSTPVMAVDQFAAGMHSLLTSTSLQWFYMQTEDNRLNADDDVRAWLETAGETMYRMFNSPKFNFASSSHELYLDQATIGTSVMSVLESPRNGLPTFSTKHLKECCVDLNEDDRVDRLTRNWSSWTARQAVDQWGLENLKRAGATKVCKAYSDDDIIKKFRFLHRVKPRAQRDAGRSDSRNKKFESVYVGFEDGVPLDIGGFDDFPYLVPRFSKLTGERYGRGPMMIALPDVKMLNELVKVVLKSAQKVVDPPLMVPDSGFIVPIKTVPGAFNYYRASSNNRIEPIKTDGQVQLGIEMINAIRQQIIRAMYVEWMIMASDPKDPASSGKGVTATYVLQQRDEKMRLMSPMLARLQAEFLGPLIDRIFAMLWRKSLMMRFQPGSPFPMPPASLSGVPLRVEYVSPIALAQKSAQMDGIGRLLQLQQQMQQIDPKGIIIVNTDFIMRTAQRDWNAPAGSLKPANQVQAETQQRDQALAQQAKTEAMGNVAGAAKDGATAVKHIAEAQAVGGGAPQAAAA